MLSQRKRRRTGGLAQVEGSRSLQAFSWPRLRFGLCKPAAALGPASGRSNKLSPYRRRRAKKARIHAVWSALRIAVAFRRRILQQLIRRGRRGESLFLTSLEVFDFGHQAATLVSLQLYGVNCFEFLGALKLLVRFRRS